MSRGCWRSRRETFRSHLDIYHAVGMHLAGIGAEFHPARAQRADMRIDRLAAEDEIASAHDVDMQRIGNALRNGHRTRADNADMNRSVDFGRAEIT